MPQSIYPPPIDIGDTIGLVAPAGPLIDKDNFTAGMHLLEKKGLKVSYESSLKMVTK
mgnify:CR=1 FL=1